MLIGPAGLIAVQVAAFPWLEVSGALAGLLAAVLLFRELASPRGDGGLPDLLRRLLFAGGAALVAYGLVSNLRGPETRRGDGEVFTARMGAEATMQVHYSGLPAAERSGSAHDRAIEELQEGLKAEPSAAGLRRRLGIVLADRGDYSAALEELRRAERDAASARGAPYSPGSVKLWEELYAGSPPSAGRLEASRPALQERRLGWMADLALLAAARRMPDGEAADRYQDAVRRSSASFLQRLLPPSIFLLVFVPQIAVVVLGVGFVLVRTGVLRREPPEPDSAVYILWESFILYMGLAALPQFIFPAPAAGDMSGLAWRLLASDGLQMLAILYLVVRLHLAGYSPRACGLTSRWLPLNLGIGLAAVFVILPGAILVGMVSTWLGNLLFPSIPAPYHPISGFAAQANSGFVRLTLLFVAAVGAPVLEEVFFRGCLYSALRRRWGIAGGIVASSAFFALLHPQLPLGFLTVAALGAAFCGLYEWRQSLAPGMVAHGLNNGFVFLILYSLFPGG